MISGLPGVVVVDDRQDELDSIKEAFFSAGIPCLPIRYHNGEPDNESGIDHVNISEWISPRIVVTDLNLTEVQGAKAPILVGPLANMLKKLSMRGPYLLCIWSKLESEVADVVRLLEERHGDEINLPLHVSVIQKSKFLTDPEKLKEKISNLISESSLFDILLNWESRVSEAGRNAVATLYTIAQHNSAGNSAEERANELRKILGAIGNEAIGIKNANDNPAIAMETGLIPVLEDQIRSMPDAELFGKWKEAVPEIGKRQDIDDAIKSKLNTFFHVEEVEEGYPKDCRGVFVGINIDYLRVKENLLKFESRIGRKMKVLLHEEFLPKTDDDAEKRLREEARDETILGFLEISPACDYAQKKIKFPRYILGALVPEKYEVLTSLPNAQGVGNKAHEGIHRLPKIEVKGKVYIVKFSFKYQFGAQPHDNQWFGASLFRVRDQILSAITFSCSQYGSRPGIISFL
ncbi:hypothetical protein [Vreelandella alkaliphila]|uniref:hypothetical protein n=1 Tax=Vreelandella alkaliphila TaxID=272774 RepID=UPI003FD8BDA2